MHVVCVSWPAQLTAACVNDSFCFLISVPSHLPWDADAQDRANELNRAVLHAQPGHSKISSTVCNKEGESESSSAQAFRRVEGT